MKSIKAKQQLEDQQKEESGIEQELRLYGDIAMPGDSAIAESIEAELSGNEIRPKMCDSIRINFSSELAPKELYAHIDTGGWHTCSCHKVAVLAFFEWNGEKFIQSPLLESDKNTKYIVLGEVDEIG